MKGRTADEHAVAVELSIGPDKTYLAMDALSLFALGRNLLLSLPHCLDPYAQCLLLSRWYVRFTQKLVSVFSTVTHAQDCERSP